MSNTVMSSAVLVALLYLMPLFYHNPNVVLAAIIITAVIGLIEYNAAMQLYKIDKLDFLACLCSFFGVLFLSVQMGLSIAVITFLIHYCSLLINYLLQYINSSKSTIYYRLVYQFSKFCYKLQGQIQMLSEIYQELNYTSVFLIMRRLREFHLS